MATPLRSTLHLLACTLLASCGAKSAPPSPSAPAPGVVSAFYANPVIGTNFPDPGIFHDGDTYYAYATAGNGYHLQVSSSQDLVHWSAPTEALPTPPAWSKKNYWAPQVDRLSDGTYIMYYAAGQSSGLMAVAVATATDPMGPFTQVLDSPWMVADNLGGVIDPAPFVDADGTRYVVFKSNGIGGGPKPTLWLQQVEADGVTLVGAEKQLLTLSKPWEGSVVEAPFMWLHDGTYYLFYSGNSFADGAYATGYATASSVGGPYTKPNAPLMASGTNQGDVIGPGGANVVSDGNQQDWLVYHTWDPNQGVRARPMSITPLNWDALVPTAVPTYGLPATPPRP